MSNILEQIVARTRLRVAQQKADMPMDVLPLKGAPVRPAFAFEQALQASGMRFICEVKRASPSKGLIAPDFPYLEIARDYARAGAAAISVLTEPDFFMGSDAYLSDIRHTVDLPLLRKDFIVDPYQIVQAKCLGADAVLLICAVLGEDALRESIALADTLGMSCLVEAHDAGELACALAAGARVIGVNNRDLRTFAVDLENSIRLRRLAPPDVLFVAESGIQDAQDVARLAASGIDAVLVGETLMRAPDKGAMLRTLRGEDQ